MRIKREARGEFKVVQLVDSEKHYRKGDARLALENADIVIDDDGLVVKDRKGKVGRRPTAKEIEEAQVVMPLRRKDD